MSSSRRRSQGVNLSDESAPLTSQNLETEANDQPTEEPVNKNSILPGFLDKFTVNTLFLAAIILILNLTLFRKNSVLNEERYSEYKTDANKTDEKDYCNKFYTEVPWQWTIFSTSICVVAAEIFCKVKYWNNLLTQDGRTKSWVWKSIKKRLGLSSHQKEEDIQLSSSKKSTCLQGLVALVSPIIEMASIFMDALYMNVIERLWILFNNEENLNDAKYRGARIKM